MDSESTRAPRARTVLVGVQLPGTSDDELTASLDELARLAKTLGLNPVARLTQARSSAGHSTVLGAGKLRELAHLTGGPGVVPSGASRREKGAKPADGDEDGRLAATHDDVAQEIDGSLMGDELELGWTPPELSLDERATVVLFDQDLTPSQLRNLEGATGVEVLDRSSVILSIFQRHARSREARLQVEIARLQYMAPRLRATGAGGERQRGGVGGRGAGESSLELNRRRVRDRVAELQHELEGVQRDAQTRRARRQRQDTVALVGYTNAGKSSLMRALSGSGVLVADQLFATLDTTVRVLQPETRPRILVSDTVGFIKKLPHDLVASFRSTLDEANEAALLLHVVDAADPAWQSQLEVTRTVLAEIGADGRPSLLVLNKADRLTNDERMLLTNELPDSILVSAFEQDDIARLHEAIVAFFERDMIDDELFVSYREQRLVHEVHESCRVLSEAHDELGTTLEVRAPREVLERLRASLGLAEHV